MGAVSCILEPMTVPDSTLLPLSIILPFLSSVLFPTAFFQSFTIFSEVGANAMLLSYIQAGPWTLGAQAIESQGQGVYSRACTERGLL